jgi:Na+-transporting methylmalonyl-CoA/oxaloacetate decarboxylase gamma subunit
VDSSLQVIYTTIIGFSVVFAVLTLIALVISQIRRFDEKWQHKEENEAEQATSKEQNIDYTTLILISAAVATIVNGKFRIRRISRVLSGNVHRTPWSSHGRAALHNSHMRDRSKF